MPSTTRFRPPPLRESVTALLSGVAVAAGVLTSVGLLFAGQAAIGFVLAALTFTAYTLGSQIGPRPEPAPTKRAELDVELTTPVPRIGRHSPPPTETLTGVRAVTPARTR